MTALLLMLIPVALAASPDHKIVGGSNVDIADFPFQVSLSFIYTST
jgi:secreted trypsin-like serine protease